MVALRSPLRSDSGGLDQLACRASETDPVASHEVVVVHGLVGMGCPQS